MPSFACTLSFDPILSASPVFEDGEGAEVQFLGAVRGEEGGRPITGIEYSVYQPMAEKVLADLGERGQREHGAHSVVMQHRLGFVPVREPSIIIRVKTKHSAEGFALCQWYLREIKTTVPIWKKPVFTTPSP